MGLHYGFPRSGDPLLRSPESGLQSVGLYLGFHLLMEITKNAYPQIKNLA